MTAPPGPDSSHHVRFRAHPVVIAVNLSLLALFPVAWTAPLVSAALGTDAALARLPGGLRRWLTDNLELFQLKEVSVLSGIETLLTTDRVLAGIVFAFAVVAPLLKTLTLAAVHFGLCTARSLPLLGWLGKLAMADVYLIALFVVIFKGINFGRIEVEWGVYLFSGCVVASLLATLLTRKSP